ncbi:triose-phosphate isomerase [Candidatus Saccharibacteria bacterium]|nr:triose-phosphate isomerase [Candidatus Saccharibacteria bacterium]
MAIKTYIMGNWKMNFTVGESSLFLHKLQTKLHPSRNLQVVVAPSLVALQPLSLQVDRRKVKLAAQNFYHRDFGAFTGEVSISQLRNLVDYAIIGHSERRHILNEPEKDITLKVAAALRNGLTPVLCIGETAEERKNGETADVIRDQLLSGLREVSKEEIKNVIIAYEPVWAISSTKNSAPATPDAISEVVDLIRSTLSSTFGAEISAETAVLFGGSVKPTNAAAYLEIPGVNGLLVGGASLIAPEFLDIIETAKRVKNDK